MKNFTKGVLFTAALAVAIGVAAETVDWGKIEHWTGEGQNKAALIIQFNTGSTPNPGAIVWGYRWDGGANPTGEEMLKAIAADSKDFLVLVQQTGDMGSTFCGAGYSKNIKEMASGLLYDFDGAITDTRISFGFFDPNTGMGQTSAPGNDTPYIIADAIAEAGTSHVIEHPLNQHTYGYPAYDYDWWQLPSTLADSYWNAGWYDGYWSYWTGGADLDTLGYSGLGMTSVEVYDGDVNAWKFAPLAADEEPDAVSGATIGWLPLNYKHFETSTGVGESLADTNSPATYYRLDGTLVKGAPSAGIYIMRRGNETRKVIVK